VDIGSPAGGSSRRPGRRYYLVREDLLPETMRRAALARERVELGLSPSVHDAVRAVGISRSAFYKYRDGVYPFDDFVGPRLVVLSLRLRHRPGVLSSVLGEIARLGGNILTISQSLPLQGAAAVFLTVDLREVEEDHLLRRLGELEGVLDAAVVGRGASPAGLG